MNKRYESLTIAEVPPELDDRILCAAVQTARRCRVRRVFQKYFWSGGAAAAALLAGFIVFQRMEPANGERNTQELLAMCDWSGLEQSSYNLCFQLDCGDLAIAELAEARIPEEF